MSASSYFFTPVLVLLTGHAFAATVLPVGPIAFATDAEYDSNFKEVPATSGITRNAAGYIELVSAAAATSTASAAFDTTSTGGTAGSGGTGGSDNNNDLGNFIISSTISVTNRTSDTIVGYLLRMNDSEAAGYLALVQVGQGNVTFRVYEGVGLSTSSLISGEIYNSGLVTTPTAINTSYNFAVTLNNGTFGFSFNNGAAVANYTDPTVSATSGQAGVFIRTPGTIGASNKIDNFQITVIPEPSGVLLGGLASLLVLKRRRR